MTQPDSAEAPDDLLLFTPVVSAYRGANGWTAEVQRAFIAVLARSGVVAVAARSVGRSARSAYQLRARAGVDSPFARAWEAAQARVGAEALDVGMAAGLEPRRVEVFYRGRHVGWRTHYENRLALAALRALDRQDVRWAAQGLDARMLLDAATELPNRRER
ncbi:hypothetical protein [Sphingomonas sp.]|jgi:hypothetical protein|uniref:hypothetical protein n=1 Tax=Sphingomonas sp. TaxID=28214 RepID=UPI002D7F3E27|nr:hypothetical protein [Sphingomonas sp.]HEU0044435.1 hypothetical protein [Sphingomonas sp.]